MMKFSPQINLELLYSWRKNENCT